MTRLVLLAGVLVALLGCAQVGIGNVNLFGGQSDLERTWFKAIVALPPAPGEEVNIATLDRADIAHHVARVAPGRRLPVVVYLHGCTGIGNYDFLRRLARTGMIVIAPDSMARKFRPLQCRPLSKTGGYNLFVYDFRLAEVSFAVHQLQRSDWADPDRLFLIGASEGAVAAALYRGDAFRARIIAQWTCHGAPLVRGIGAPPETPILAVVKANDPWYDPTRTVAQRGDCGVFMQGRPGARSIVTAGNGHDVFTDPVLVQEMMSFLDRFRR